MANVAIPIWIFWFIMFYALALKGIIAWLIIKYIKRYNTDLMLMIDKNNRWTLINQNFSGKTETKVKDKAYFLQEKCGLVNKRGKALYVFAQNKPQPLQLDYNKSKWLDSKSLMAIINNKLVQMIVKPKENVRDILILLGAIGGLVAGVASVVNLLKTTGVI